MNRGNVSIYLSISIERERDMFGWIDGHGYNSAIYSIDIY